MSNTVTHPVAPVRTEQSGRVAKTLASAFQDDPALSWILPDPAKRRKVLPRFFAVMAEQSYRHGEVLASTGTQTGTAAAALWYPPGDMRDSVREYLWDSMRLLGLFGGALPRGLKVAEAMHAHHPHPQTYTYLRYVGVSPEAQGKGWGGAIIRAGIERAASNGADKSKGVLLETAKPANVAIYTRLGFAITEEWHVPGGGPKFWTMIRPADAQPG